MKKKDLTEHYGLEYRPEVGIINSDINTLGDSDWVEYPYDVGKLHFPRDEGIHDYAHEWWYLNLHLFNVESGRKFDVMTSYFPKQELLPVPYRYFMITDIANNRYIPTMKFKFAGMDCSDQKLDLKFNSGFFRKDRWIQLETKFAFEYLTRVNAGNYGLNVLLRSMRPPLPVDGDGYVQVGSGYSYYYSLTRLHVAGFLKIHGKNIPVVGTGWMDHQFGDFFQSDKNESYEWFCLQLDNNVDVICWYTYLDGEMNKPIMTYMLNDGSIVKANDSFSIELLDYWLSPKLKKYGSNWRIKETEHNLDVTVKTTIPNQLSYVPYPFTFRGAKRFYLVGLYEAGSTIEGSMDGESVRGRGYIELTHNR